MRIKTLTYGMLLLGSVLVCGIGKALADEQPVLFDDFNQNGISDVEEQTPPETNPNIPSEESVDEDQGEGE